MFKNKQSIFLVLLAALLLLLVTQPLVVGMAWGQVLLSVFASLLQIVAILVLAENRRLRVFAWVFGLPTIIAIWSRHYYSESAQEAAMAWAHGFTSLFLAVTAVLILRFVLTHDVTADSVVGAICAYLMIGVVMGHLYYIVATLHPHAFRTSAPLAAEIANPESRAALLMYYSFCTLTTTGYGDIVPSLGLTRTMAWLEAATGQLYLAVLVAGLVSMRVSQRLARPAVDHARKHVGPLAD